MLVVLLLLHEYSFIIDLIILWLSDVLAIVVHQNTTQVVPELCVLLGRK